MNCEQKEMRKRGREVCVLNSVQKGPIKLSVQLQTSTSEELWGSRMVLGQTHPFAPVHWSRLHAG